VVERLVSAHPYRPAPGAFLLSLAAL
jgi:hypothetical protein